MILWRISNHVTLDGLGGLNFSARWHTKGRAIVYAADHPASALLEMLAHSDKALLPASFQMLKIGVPPNTVPKRLPPAGGWRDSMSISRGIGDQWLEHGESLLLEVPSAILPDVFHTLINPAHPDAPLVKIISVQSVPLDQRLK
jgi:RES domain-containing protein